MKPSPYAQYGLSYWLAAGTIVVALAAPAAAASLKSIMKGMGDNTASAKALLSNYDSQAASDVLRRYSDDIRAADAFAGGGSAKQQDFHARFARLDAILASASQKKLDKAAFQQTMTSVMSECKSCHAAND